MGASGGSKIISALAKPIIRVLCFNETIKQAIDAPTLHNQFTPDITQYEAAVPKVVPFLYLDADFSNFWMTSKSISIRHSS